MAKVRYYADLYKHGRHFNTQTVELLQSFMNRICLRYRNYQVSKPVEGQKYSTLYKDITKLLQRMTALLLSVLSFVCSCLEFVSSVSKTVFVCWLSVAQNKTMYYYQYGLGIQKSYLSYQFGLSLGGKW